MRKMNLVCISDTHTQHRSMPDIPMGDVLIHAGDITGRGEVSTVEDFCDWFGGLPHPNKIVIPGNHDWCFQNDNKDAVEEMVRNCAHYLIDSSVVIGGVKFYGSPWQPDFCNWAFNLPRGKPLADIWAKIEPDTDVLVTHGPPLGILDWCPGGNVGDEDLLCAIRDLNLKYHIFGHIHESYGIEKRGKLTHVNASTCTGSYKPSNKPICVKVP